MSETLGRRRIAIAVLIAATPIISACHVCRTRQVTGRLTGQITVAGQTTPLTMSGGASEATIGTQYDRLARVVADASTDAVAQTMTWTLEQALPAGVVDFLAVQMPLPVQQGASIPVTLVPRMGGWGAEAPGARPAPAGIYIAKAGFVATSAEGNLLVLDTTPLRLRLNVAFRGEDGRTVAIAGDVPFQVQDDKDLCSFQ
jgi:hypothetical protein